MRVLDLLGEQEMEIKEEDAPLSSLLDDLAQVPHVEGVLQHYLAEAVSGHVAALQQRQVHGVVGLLRHG